MFGGLCFMVNGAMCCGLTKTDFMVRVGPAGYDVALREPHARPMDFTGRALAGMVFVAREGLWKDAALAKWIGRGVSFVAQPETEGAKGVGLAKRSGKGSKAAVERSAKAPAAPEDIYPRISALLAALKGDRELAPIVDAFLESRSAGPVEEVRLERPQGEREALRPFHAGDDGGEAAQGAGARHGLGRYGQAIRPGAWSADGGVAHCRRAWSAHRQHHNP
jgi:hypothetical protein